MIQAMSSKEIKRDLGRRIAAVNRPEFLDSRIRPHFSDAEVNGGGWETRVLQLDGTGAATLEINLDGHKVFAKFYHPGDDNAPLIYDKLKTLRASGFGPGERYQVVEPLGFIPEYGLLLTRGAEGPAVSDSIDGDEEALLSGAVQSARWLAKLHSSPVRIGAPRSLAASSELLSVARRLAKVMTRSPEHLKTADRMIREMERMAEETVDGILVQGHGQYRPIHVFIGGSSVTVIDMDRSRPYDPAYDVVEFLHRMRKAVLKHAGSAEPADAPTEAFLETYISAVSDRSCLANLSFHWARFILHGLNGEMKDDQTGDPEFDRDIAFYHSEFENVLDGRFSI
jgi:hypothetical protein